MEEKEELIKKLLQRIRDRFLKQVLCQFEQLEQKEALLKAGAVSNFRTRAMLKQAHDMSIHVVFVCHALSMWSMFESVYHAMEEDTGFSPLVIAFVSLLIRYP